MKTLLAATAALAVGFALPAMAANNGQQGQNQGQGQAYNQGQGYNQNQGWGQQSYNQGQQGWGNGQQAYQGSQTGNQGSGWQNQASSNRQAQMNLRQTISHDLSQAGFTDIHIMPRSFVVHAKDRSGNPVEMLITPNSLTEVAAVPAGNQNGQQGQNGQMAQNGQQGRMGQKGGALGTSTVTNSEHAGNAINSPNGNGTTVR